MKLCELKDLIIAANDKGYGDVEVEIVCENESVDDGREILGVRCACDAFNNKESKYVFIVER